ncbi:YdeI/OmpD-associated family protein [Paenibacillus sp. LHD-117]|uniref:YdeI/OmpD-associated family protein n=1 Tax=Paenibacillus sp. LHD-117 TaxID=3071412 RepID=UPI0027DF4ECE|nr:YdeI/OmpD-associated family protein [Paenibacillus sp. LHD-117]MDQ6419408.1 YdeI/OmpD-associated family protein [Paenibacillus sp. LHD-117]
MKFRTVIELGGKTATGFEVPAEAVEALEQGKKPAVNVTIGGHTYRSTVAVYGGKYMLPLSAENRGAAGVSAGDEVEVEIALDMEPRELVVPDDFAEALGSAQSAKVFFDGLSYSNRRRIVLQIEGAKTEETRKRRIDKSILSLIEGKI